MVQALKPSKAAGAARVRSVFLRDMGTSLSMRKRCPRQGQSFVLNIEQLAPFRKVPLNGG